MKFLNYSNYLIFKLFCPRLQRKASSRGKLFFIKQAERPKGATAGFYEKIFPSENLQRKAGIGT